MPTVWYSQTNVQHQVLTCKKTVRRKATRTLREMAWLAFSMLTRQPFKSNLWSQSYFGLCPLQTAVCFQFMSGQTTWVLDKYVFPFPSISIVTKSFMTLFSPDWTLSLPHHLVPEFLYHQKYNNKHNCYRPRCNEMCLRALWVKNRKSKPGKSKCSLVVGLARKRETVGK